MTDKQKIFCDEYLIDFNATRAYKNAYPNCKKENSARKAGSRLLTNVDIQEYIEQKMKEREERTTITQDMVIKELSKVAFSDIRKLYTDKGNLKFMKDLDDDIAGAISGIETLEEYEGYGENREKIGDTKKVKLLDKTKALELLGKHLGMFKEKINLGQDEPFEINISIKKN